MPHDPARAPKVRAATRRFLPFAERLEDHWLPSTTDPLANLPMYFEDNQGQTDTRVEYLARGRAVARRVRPMSLPKKPLTAPCE